MKHILIADDEPEVARIMQRGLARQGYAVETAADGQRAITFCQATPPDLVITDIYMDKRDGLELIADLRDNFPGIKIIAMSGNPTAPTFLRVSEFLGAHRTLTKPFLMPEMLRVVGEVLSDTSSG